MRRTHIALIAPMALALTTLAGTRVFAETNSYVDKGYEYSTLHTWDFKTQRRISSDPIANNRIWGNDIRSEVSKDLQRNGFEHVQKGQHPDFLVAFYVGLKERYDVQLMDYGFPGWGPRRFRWGWPGDVDVWKIPYTDSTLVVDIIDGQTNQLIWRGYDTNTIDMKKPDRRLDKAVDSLVKHFLKDRDEATS